VVGSEISCKNLNTISTVKVVNKLLIGIQASFHLSERELKNLNERSWRFSAQIRQPRKDDRSCNKTPFFDRWKTDPNTSYITPADNRYATENECERIQLYLLAKLCEAFDASNLSAAVIELSSQILNRPIEPQSLRCFHTDQPITADDIKKALQYTTQRIGSYEIPSSYYKELNLGGKHEASNIGWMKPVHAVYMLRAALENNLRDSGVPTNAINTALDKIQVKAYCTDKQTMPPFFSNRDIRWETWPASPCPGS
jgi:hypothetical protein